MILNIEFLSLGVILIAFICHRLLKWRKRSYLYSLLPGPKGQHPLLGDVPILIGRSKSCGIDLHVALLQSMMGLTHIFRKDGLCRVWLGLDPYVFLFSAEAVEPILTSQTALQKAELYKVANGWLKEGLITSGPKKWKSRRKVLTPAFHYRILDEFLPVFDRQAKNLVGTLDAFSNGDTFDVVPVISIHTLGVICETAMGIETGTIQKEFTKYVEGITEFGRMAMKRFAQPWLQNDFIFYFSSDYSKYVEILKTLHQFTRKVVKERKKELLEKYPKGTLEEPIDGAVDNFGIKRKQAFLDLLLQFQLRDGSLSDDDISEEVDTFMFAGHDTTSAGIYWTLYHLGRHPEVQEKAYQELFELLGDDKDREVTLKDINEMKYLDRIIKESERITPTAPMMARVAPEGLNIKGYSIPSGTQVLTFILSLHHDPNVFPHPEVFDPDRFLVENSLNRHPFAFIPFSAGPRNCIGQRFAMLEMKVTLCHIIRNFVVEAVDPFDRISLTALMILKSSDGLKIKLKRRD